MIEQKKNLNYIDSLRGVAILMVVWVHTTSGIQNLSPRLKSIGLYGQMGVQLFFLASAYTLCLSLDAYYNKKNWLIIFYLKRFFRIAPLYYLAIGIYFLNAYLIHIEYKHNIYFLHVFQNYSLKNIAFNITFLHGFYLPANNNIVPGGWSIGTEMAFYFIFPVLYLIYKRIFIALRGNWMLMLIPIHVFVVLVQWQLILFISKNSGLSLKNNDFLYYNLVNQLSVFLIGILYYFFTTYYEIKIHKYVLIILFIVSIIFSFVAFNKFLNVTLVPVFSAVSFLFLFILFKNIRLLNLPILMKIGKLSFSIYIFHFLFANAFTKGLSKYLFHGLYPNYLLIVCFLGITFFSVVVANFSNRVIESKGILLGSSLIKRYFS